MSSDDEDSSISAKKKKNTSNGDKIDFNDSYSQTPVGEVS
jgi:hypothetical protein